MGRLPKHRPAAADHSPASGQLETRAREIVTRLVGCVPSIEAACLFGSVARGEASPWSDIDLLLIGSERRVLPSVLIKCLRPSEREARISLSYRSADALVKDFEQGALFIEHLRREGRALYDRSGILGRLLSRPFTLKLNVEDALADQLRMLKPYERPERFNGNFLFPLSHLYSIGKGVVMLGLGRAGTFEFNRERAFERFKQLHPEAAPQVEQIARLRPFYNLVTHRRPEPLPFSYKLAAAPLRESVQAIKDLASAATSG